MIYLLDTNLYIRVINKRSAVAWQMALSHPVEQLSFAVSSGLSFWCIEKSDAGNNSTQTRPFASLSFDDFAANTCGRIRANLEQNDMTIGTLELQFAALAFTHNPTFVSHNIREFSRIPHLQLGDWGIV